nr:hypothetical protein [Tanacetum cinerariifolium]
MPPHCVDCIRFGHDTSLCPKRVCEEVLNISARDTKATVMEEKDDGFKEVKSRYECSSPPVLKKWDVINESDTTDDEAGFTLVSTSVGGGNQLEDEDSDIYDGYE